MMTCLNFQKHASKFSNTFSLYQLPKIHRLQYFLIATFIKASDCLYGIYFFKAKFSGKESIFNIQRVIERLTDDIRPEIKDDKSNVRRFR